MLDYIQFPLRQLTCTYTKHILYSRQMVYNSGSLPKTSAKKPENNQLNRFKSFLGLYIIRSLKHIVCVLQVLSYNIDNEGVNEPTSFKKAKIGSDWPK